MKTVIDCILLNRYKGILIDIDLQDMATQGTLSVSRESITIAGLPLKSRIGWIQPATLLERASSENQNSPFASLFRFPSYEL